MKQSLVGEIALVLSLLLLSTIVGAWMGWPRHHHGNSQSRGHSQDRKGRHGRELFIPLTPESQATKEVKNYVKQMETEIIDRIKFATGAGEVVGGSLNAISFLSRATSIQDKLADYEEYDLDQFYGGTHYFVKVGAKVKGGKKGLNHLDSNLYFHIRIFKMDGTNKIQIVGMDESPYVKQLQDRIQPFGLFDIFIENVKDPLNLPRLKESGIIVDPKDSSKILHRPKINYD